MYPALTCAQGIHYFSSYLGFFLTLPHLLVLSFLVIHHPLLREACMGIIAEGELCSADPLCFEEIVGKDLMRMAECGGAGERPCRGPDNDHWTRGAHCSSSPGHPQLSEKLS